MRDVGFLHETGDRWILDTLIPNRDRRLIGPQVPRTSILQTGTKVQITTAKVDKRLTVDTSVHSYTETTLDEQHRLRRRYCGDVPLPGDRLL